MLCLLSQGADLAALEVGAIIPFAAELTWGCGTPKPGLFPECRRCPLLSQLCSGLA